MAASKNKTWGPTHPSSAFLIKCHKEREKLRVNLQSQLQNHILQMLQNQTFSDVNIEVNTISTDKQEKNHIDFQKFLPVHKSILKIRTPTFLNHLNGNQEIHIESQLYKSHLQESELKEFLRKIYTDDDIRKYECEAIHLSKKYIELQHHNAGFFNKHILDVDEFEKESVNSSCTDNFVTPVTSPLTPDPQVDALSVFAPTKEKLIIHEKKDDIDMNEPFKSGNLNTKLYIDLDVDKVHHTISKSPRECMIDSLGEDSFHEHFNSQGDVDSSIQSCDVSIPGFNTLSSDIDSPAPEDFPNINSMVRSNTFDLETQCSLEDAGIEDSIEWCDRNTNKNELPVKEETENDNCLSLRRADGSGFYLHDHTPSPRSNPFKNSFGQELYSRSLEPDSGVHYRRLDGSLSDSGFISHSTFSLLSEAGYTNSVASSLIMSSDGMGQSGNSSVNGKDHNVPLSERTKQLSGSMFPFYVDMNNLPPPISAEKAKKTSPSHTYMFIDAHNQKVTVSSKDQHSRTSSFEHFFSEITADEFGRKEPLIKAQSTSQLDCKPNRYVKMPRQHRPQSCYMYVDLDSVADTSEEHSQSKVSLRSSQPSVCMFVDLNNDIEKSKTFDQGPVKPFLRSTSEGQQKVSTWGEFSKSNTLNQQKRKLSDSFLSSNQTCLDDQTKFFSLNKNGSNSSKSATLFDHSNSNKSDGVQQFHSPGPHKPRNTYRFSDGVYYDNLNHSNLSNCNFNSLDRKLLKDPHDSKDLKVFDPAFRFKQKNDEASGSCSNLGWANISDKLLSDDKTRWKSMGEMEKPKSVRTDTDTGLLPMSPILRRKKQAPEVSEPKPPPVIVKASTKPQDLDAMKFPKPLQCDFNQICERVTKECILKCETSILSPANRKLDRGEGSKSSSESLRIESDVLLDTCELKSKNISSMSQSGSSIMTGSGGDSSSETSAHHDHHSRDKIVVPAFCEFDDDCETIYSEVSDISSSLGGVASLERRWQESQNHQMTYNSKNLRAKYQMLEACSKLGEDLLRMFLEEIDADVILDVDGKNIKAHRCILASRTKYFANLLKSHSSDENSNTITFPGYSYTSVHFALCHIYSGAMNIPKECDIAELALLADLLCLDSLTDVIVFHLKMHFCHFFHRPCLQCSQGVVECLTLTTACGLNDLRDKCIYWLGKNFTRTWTNKGFAALSEELRELCYKVTVSNLSVDTVIDMTLNCDRLLTTLPQLKWTEPIFGMITKLLQDCIHFMAKYFNQILNSEGFLALGKGQSWNVSALEEDIISSIELMSPDIACKSYDVVNRLIISAESIEHSGYGEFTQNFIDLLHKISRHSERYLIQNANKVAHCENWRLLSPQVQKRIKDAAVIVFEFEKPIAPPPRLSSLQRKMKKSNEGEDISCIERSTYPKKGRDSPSRKHPRDFSHKNGCSRQESPDRSASRRECENVLKKMVSPIKEEAQCHSTEQDISFEFQNSAHKRPYFLPARSQASGKVYVDAHEEDSLRDLLDLPQDQTNVLESGAESVGGELDGSRSDNNPDSLDGNEKSVDSKDEDLSVSAEDGSKQEKGVNEKPETHDKNLESLNIGNAKKSNNCVAPNRKSSLTMSDSTSTTSVPQEKDAPNRIRCDKSPIKKLHGKSMVPLPTASAIEESRVSVDSKSKDLVAEIDADSRMVSHCLQEAEMLEQQLSRKLQRQHLDGTPTQPQYISVTRPHSSIEHAKSPKTNGYRLQKASSTSQIKNFSSNASRGRSPGRSTKSNASSPSVSHPPRIHRNSDASREKSGLKKSSKNVLPNSNRSFQCADGNLAKLPSSAVPGTPKRVSSSKPTRSKPINVPSGKSVAVGPK